MKRNLVLFIVGMVVVLVGALLFVQHLKPAGQVLMLGGMLLEAVAIARLLLGLRKAQ